MANDPDNALKDGSVGSIEFRQFLTEIDTKKLASFATYCLESSFPDSGQVLQDIVNEIGRRLGFTAENGRYRGVRNDIGYDGIWTSKEGSLVVEVKTTDAYTIRLDTIVNYRDRLAEDNRIPRDTPILIVIGRNDTSSLEAQVRGSRYAWSMRIVGIDALIKLMEVNRVIKRKNPDTGEVEDIQADRKVSPWWWQGADGKWFLSIKYGTQTLELAKGKGSIQVEGLAGAERMLRLVGEATEKGELDDILMAAGSVLRKRFQT